MKKIFNDYEPILLIWMVLTSIFMSLGVYWSYRSYDDSTDFQSKITISQELIILEQQYLIDKLNQTIDSLNYYLLQFNDLK